MNNSNNINSHCSGVSSQGTPYSVLRIITHGDPSRRPRAWKNVASASSFLRGGARHLRLRPDLFLTWTLRGPRLEGPSPWILGDIQHLQGLFRVRAHVFFFCPSLAVGTDDSVLLPLITISLQITSNTAHTLGGLFFSLFIFLLPSEPVL